MIRNVHTRTLDATPAQAGALIDSLAGADDRLWPAGRWPALQLDGGLAVGARGGHGPIRYAVSDLDPGRLACFRFDPRLFDGHHAFTVTTRDGRTVLRHDLDARPQGTMRLLWPLAVRRLHDALIEDALDRAEAGLAGADWRPRRLGLRVRAARYAAASLSGAPSPGAAIGRSGENGHSSNARTRPSEANLSTHRLR